MPLTAYTGTVDAGTINANFDDGRTALLVNRAARMRPAFTHLFKGVDDGTATPLLERVYDFTPNDDVDLRAVRIYVQTNVGPDDVTATLTCPAGDHYLLEQTLSYVLDGSVDANHHTDDDMLGNNGDGKVTLKKGVTYRITVVNSTTTQLPFVQVSLMTTQKPRRR